MTARDELAQVIHDVDYYGLNLSGKVTERARETADAVLAAGWRKMPSREDFTEFLGGGHDYSGVIDIPFLAGAILDYLMEGGTE